MVAEAEERSVPPTRPVEAGAEPQDKAERQLQPLARAGYLKLAALVPMLSAGKAGQAGPEIVDCARNGAAAAETGTIRPAKTPSPELFLFGAVAGVDPVEVKGRLKATPEPLVAAPGR